MDWPLFEWWPQTPVCPQVLPGRPAVISLMISLTPTTFYTFSSLFKPPVPFAPSLSSAENVASYWSRKIWATERERLHPPVTKSACSQTSSPALPSHPAASVSLWAWDTTPHLLEHFPPDFSISCTTIVFPVCTQTRCESPLLNVWINKNQFLTLLPMLPPFFCFPFWRIALKQFPAERCPLCLPRSCSPGKGLLQGGRPRPSCRSTGPRSFLSSSHALPAVVLCTASPCPHKRLSPLPCWGARLTWVFFFPLSPPLFHLFSLYDL